MPQLAAFLVARAKEAVTFNFKGALLEKLLLDQ